MKISNNLYIILAFVLLLAIVVLIMLYNIFFYKFSPLVLIKETVKNKNCIAVLTRGYEDIKQYDLLIKRNNSILQNLNDTSTNILIFHEGNITEQHQVHIQTQTPALKLKFIDISHIAFQKSKEAIPFEEAHGFGHGYRHMCSFWFVSFFDIVKDYDKLLRIDEDCIIESNIDNIFLELNNNLFVCGHLDKDEEFVTKGLNAFSLEFLNKNKEIYNFKNADTKEPGGPYTNLIGFNLDKMRKIELFEKYRIEIDKSNMIYKRRWGDLPLWGEVIYYIFGHETMKVDKTIKYFHGSHNMKVNY